MWSRGRVTPDASTSIAGMGKGIPSGDLSEEMGLRVRQ